MNHLETHFPFTQLGRKLTEGQHQLPSAHLPSPSHLLQEAPLSSSIFSLILTTAPLPHLPSLPCVSHIGVPVLCILTVSASPVSQQLWRTAGSSWWISLTTNCGCLCPMCHSPTRDAMCASSTQILLRKPMQTSLSWVGVRVHVWTSEAYHTPRHTHFFCIFTLL